MQSSANQLNKADPLENPTQSFFHEAETFQTLEQSILNEILAKKNSGVPIKILVWGCGSGQEAYSVAISMFRKAQIIPSLNYEILGIDKNSHSIDRARIGLYDDQSFQNDVAQRSQTSYFKKIDDEWRVLPQIKNSVQFSALDIYDNFSPLGKADIIFARYFLGHFTPKLKSFILDKFADLLNPRGHLVLGRLESLLSLSADYTLNETHRGTYQKKI